ncbi:MAG: PIN domain-containing protein [Flavobacteriales bacterium]|nr:PIN domain-containing protein [Flavobacteriales bacterium]
MIANSVLLDTNVIVSIFQGHETLAAELEGKHLYVSVLPRIELYSWRSSDIDRVRWLDEFLGECELVEMDRRIQDLSIGIRRNYNLAVVDAVIAATALGKDLPLLTADQDFAKLDGAVKVILLEGWPKK